MSNLYFSRELSWLKFNERVLEEACRADMPLFERLRFVSIFASNLDEFYMVRIGSLLDQTLISGRVVDNKTQMTPGEQIEAVNSAVQALYPRRDNAYRNIMESLSSITCYHAGFKSLNTMERHIVRAYFETEVLPILSPQIIDLRHPFPHLENKQIYIGARMKSKEARLYGIVPLPREQERIYMIPGGKAFLLLEDLVLHYIDAVFEIYNVEAKAVFRVTRNADIDFSEGLSDEDTNYREYMQEMLKKRRKLSPIRLETSSVSDENLTGFFLSKLRLSKSQCFLCQSPLDMGFVAQLESHFDPKVKERLVYAPLRPQWPEGLKHGRMIAQIQQNDMLLCYPYESMRPVSDLLLEASEDSRVVSIKMTLYRIGSESQIIRCLCAAAENGKDVTVRVELRARFDEQANINWAAVLEESGCKVIYGIDDCKVHSKLILITLRSPRGPQYIANISTGNYNEFTARLYADLSFFTADPTLCNDAVRFFHNMEIGNLNGSYRRFLVSPLTLKSGVLDLMDKEIQKAATGRPALILAKMNSLTDKEVIDKLIAASQAGVSVKLLIRGICCLRPGVGGYTENIEVYSIVGRFLEHARVFCFGAGEDAVVYIGSADLMTRNTEHRVEVLAPVENKKIAARVIAILQMQLKDNVKTHILQPDGNYLPVRVDGERVDSQLIFFEEAYRKAAAASLKEAQYASQKPLILRWLRSLRGKSRERV